jgi:hypothetical protein
MNLNGVGVTLSEPGLSAGYTLFMPLQSNRAFLMDCQGNVVHYWEGPTLNSGSTLLLENGHLLYSGMYYNNGETPPYGYPGAGEIVELDWNSQVVWEYEFASDSSWQHHDLEVLPNGDILFLAWELLPAEAVLQAGRDPTLIPEEGILADAVFQVHKTETGGEIVWEWRVWDNLVQDLDSSKDNYGSVRENPGNIDLNFQGTAYASGRTDMDWTHVNSLDYNAKYDQIILSSRNFGERWVIEHDEDAPGGRSESGIVYRWGNPQAYDRGGAGDQILFGQHDVQWIDEGLPGEGDILVFNNGVDRPGPGYSSIIQITPDASEDGSYSLGLFEPYGPPAPSWEYHYRSPTDFYSSHISGAQRLSNGNTLICSGMEGRFFEVDPAGDVVWDFINPIYSEFSFKDAKRNPNLVFDCQRYPLDYPGIVGHSLSSVPLASFPSTIGFTKSGASQSAWMFSVNGG